MTAERHDAWQAGDSYDGYMGRWSRKVAPLFLQWLDCRSRLSWLEVGCGTGALTASILDLCDPESLIATDASEGFIRKALVNVTDPRVEFRVEDAQALGLPSASCDVAASALVLNFVPDRVKAVREMKRAVRPEGMVAFYVWDYPGGGIEFMRAFWTAAVALDPGARDLTEDRRFPFCTSDGLIEMAREGGLRSIECIPIEVPTIFRDFEDFWKPFTLGAGPAPGYCVSLEPDVRERLREKLHQTISPEQDGSIRMKARAWAVKAVA